jgi:hypothetical protein
MRDREGKRNSLTITLFTNCFTCDRELLISGKAGSAISEPKEEEEKKKMPTKKLFSPLYYLLRI